MSKGPDLALRRLVADLAELGPADVAAILASLEPAQQARVRAMLGELLGEPSRASGAASAPEPIWSPALAPWLRERLGAPMDNGDGLTPRPPGPAMTDAGREALMNAAHAAGAWITPPPPAPPPAGRKAGRMGTLWSALRGAQR